MLKAIVFDLGGVIFSSNATSYEGREKLARQIGIEPSKLQEFWFERREQIIIGKISEDGFFGELISTHQLPISLQEIKDIIRDSDVINQEMLTILAGLKNHFQLFALTNDVKEWIEYRINKFNLKKYFEMILSSSEIGLAKPDPKIYNYLFQKTDLNAKDIIFVDDRIENVNAAESLGIKSFHFTNAKEFKIWLEKENTL